MFQIRSLFFMILVSLAGCSVNSTPANSGNHYLENALLPPPLQPADLTKMSLNCALSNQSASTEYRTAAQVDYERSDWEQRVAADWRFFAAPASAGAVMVIDFRRSDNQLSYRYLANDATHNQLYEPWSSSKIQAFTTAVSALRQHGIGADATAGGVALRDLVTSINSYASAGLADGNSNAIATWLLNLAGRDYATDLFYASWLKLARPDIRFRGAYGPTVFAPSPNEVVSADGATRFAPASYANASDDPGYRTYRCKTCGRLGNKAMTSLAQTEWLKRLASHQREPSTRHPHLQTSDVETLFFGGVNRPQGDQMQGMLAGISVFLPEALAEALAPASNSDAKTTLDDITRGRWRVYQKVGWGPSETRGTSELVMLAHVCLPQVQGSGREFTLLARASVVGAEEDQSGVGRAGLKLRQLLDRSLPALLAAQN